jgi:transcriptional regulator with XRE-family HTH domain
MDIHKHIAEARIKQGITQQQAAEQLGVTRGHWANYETGGRIPLPDHVPAMAKFLRLTDSVRDALLRRAIAEHESKETNRLIGLLERQLANYREQFARIVEELRRRDIRVPESLGLG